MNYCKTCGEPTERTFPIPDGNLQSVFGTVLTVPRACKCKRIQFAKEDAEREKREAAERREKILRNSLMLESYRKMTFDRDDGQDKRLGDLARRYVDKAQAMLDENIGLIFTGVSGTGKTFMAGCIANALIDKGFSVLMTNIPTLVSELSSNFDENREYVLERIRRRQFLILDDFGFQRGTDFMNEKVFEIINARYESGKPLIITTNMESADFKRDQTITNARIIDRLNGMAGAIIEAKVPRRMSQRSDKRDRLKEVLGL